MTSSYDSTGVTLDKFADVLARMIALAEETQGNISTDEDTFEGHIIKLLATVLAEINDTFQGVYDARSVSGSAGTYLDNLLELVNISRSAAAYSTATLTITATAATTVPAGTQYSTATGITFATDSELVFTAAGDDTVDATCTVVGANDAGAGTVTEIVNSVFAISDVTNAADATPGRLRETDSEMRIRHTVATATSGDSDAGSIYEAITAVDSVSSAYIHDNDTDGTVDSVPAGTIHCSAIGGDEDEIAAAINASKTASVPMYGSTTVSVYDTITSQTKDIKFSVAANVPIYITVEVEKLTGMYPDDGDALMRAALVDFVADLQINDDVEYKALYRPIYAVPGGVVNDLFIGTAATPSGEVDLTMTALQRAQLTTAQAVTAVVITEV
ncbi:MAG: hypothetical protein GY847_28810 [Proteobacteria bacterium]|nr:hypothetical protein [Pseudomonadota bacterium]